MLIYELVIEDENVDEVFAISLVENPAIESNFVYFNKSEIQFAKINNEKRMVMGPILIPNKRIPRIGGDGIPYEVFFKPETVSKLAQMYLEKKYTDKTTIEHESDVKNVSLVESWIVESIQKDKSKLYGLNVPVGTWMGTFKINNDEIWDEYVKTGKVKGFSIEGIFGHNLVGIEDFKEDYFLSNIEDLEAKQLLEKIKAIIKNEEVKLESYSDYGDGIRNNAKRGIELNEAQGNKCGTQVGKVRAQQLANGEPISVETIKRMYSYLSRAEVYYDESNTTECGTISYLLWGGKAALGWSRNKLRELGLLEEGEVQPSVNSTYPGEASGSFISPEVLQEEGLDIFGYRTSHFDICPGAIGTFTELINTPMDNETIGMVRSAAVVADKVFEIEKEVVNSSSTDSSTVREVEVLVDDFKDVINEISEDVGKLFDVSYMNGHIEVVKSYL